MDIEIGARLREERERLNLSQAALAEIGGKKKLAQLKYEQGESSPTAAYLAAARRVGIDVLYVVTGERTAQHLPPEEVDLLVLFRAASREVRAAAKRALQGTASSPQTFNAPVTNVAGRDVKHVTTGKVKQGKNGKIG